MERVSVFALNLIILTIALNYVFIAVASGEGFGSFLDEDLTGVGTRSVFNLNPFLLLLGLCFMILCFELIFSRTVQCWRIKSVSS